MSYEIYIPEPEHHPQELGDLLGSLSGEIMKRGRSMGAAYAVWVTATGAKERSHTMGVYLAEPNDPANHTHKRTLTVYVDSNAIMQDLRTNAELYLLKLARAGMALDGIEFRLSKKQRTPLPDSEGESEPAQNVSKETRKPFTSEEKAELKERLDRMGNEELRDSFIKAMGIEI